MLISSRHICVRSMIYIIYMYISSIGPLTKQMDHVVSKPGFHVIGFSDIVDLWEIKIKKSPWSFAHVVRRDHVNRARNANHAARTYERFVYCRVKITRLHDYQTWQTHFWRNSRGAQGFVGFLLWLCFSDADWLGKESELLCNHLEIPLKQKETAIIDSNKAVSTLVNGLNPGVSVVCLAWSSW